VFDIKKRYFQERKIKVFSCLYFCEMEFSLKGNEFIELNKLIKLLNIVESGGAANQMIIERLVLRNQKIETRKRCKLRVGDIITIEDQNIKVSIID
tara:strand:+ start:80 stop:367 length:288 start_codon:yes stop_codon:yes gene_type:complete